MDILGMVGNFFGGGVLGTVAGGVLGLLSKGKELELAKINNAQALELRKLDIAAAKDEAVAGMQKEAADLLAHKVDLAAGAVKDDIGAMNAAIAADKATYGDAVTGQIVDFIRGLIRPVITAGAFWLIAEMTLKALADGNQVQLSSSMNLCAVPIGYWFGSRFTTRNG